MICRLPQRISSSPPAPASPHLTITFAYNVDNTSYAYARVPSTSTTNITYQSAQYNSDIAKGTKFRVYVSGPTNYRSQCYIMLNGTKVKSGYGNGYFTVNSGNISVKFEKNLISNYCYCTVTGDCTYSTS